MEEVDNIIIHTLREIGCSLVEDVQTLREFTVEMVVHAVSTCLSKINDETSSSIPSSLPSSMSARFRIGSTLATTCKELGYKGEVGYQTFLYANELDLRNVLMFLIEKLPKESGNAIDDTAGSVPLLNRRIAEEMKRQLSTPWVPGYCRRKNLVKVNTDDFFFQGKKSFHKFRTCPLRYPRNSINDEQGGSIPFLGAQLENIRDLPSSLVEENSYYISKDQEWENEWRNIAMASRLSVEEYKKQKRDRLLKRIREKMFTAVEGEAGLLVAATTGKSTGGLKELLSTMAGESEGSRTKGSRFTHTEKLVFAQDEEEIEAKIVKEQQQQQQNEGGGTDVSNEIEREEEAQEKREAEIQSLRDELNQLSLKSHNYQTELKQLLLNKEKIDEEVTALQNHTKELETAHTMKKKTVDLLPDAEHNIAKLQEVIANSEKKLVNLQDQWEKHRLPLVEKYQLLKQEKEAKSSEVETIAEQVRNLREKMKNTTDELKGKEDVHKQLTAEFEAMTVDLNRAAYTKRILEIVSNIKKQKDQIAKILIDTKDLQKDINFLTGKLDRTFIVTDELIFKDAKKDEFSKKAYKLVAGLHESFGSLVGTIENTGTIMREIRELEDQMDQLSEKEIEANMKKIADDLRQIREENQNMIATIKSKR